jgi:hypothetical protein
MCESLTYSVLSVFETNDRSYEQVASSLNVGDVSVAELAIPERLADGGYVDPEGSLLHGDVRPDMIHEFLISDDLAWTFCEIDQNLERPTTDGKQLTVAPEYPLANRKVERTESQLPVNCCARHGQPISPVCVRSVGKR